MVTIKTTTIKSFRNSGPSIIQWSISLPTIPLVSFISRCVWTNVTVRHDQLNCKEYGSWHTTQVQGGWLFWWTILSFIHCFWWSLLSFIAFDGWDGNIVIWWRWRGWWLRWTLRRLLSTFETMIVVPSILFFTNDSSCFFGTCWFKWNFPFSIF